MGDELLCHERQQVARDFDRVQILLFAIQRDLWRVRLGGIGMLYNRVF